MDFDLLEYIIKKKGISIDEYCAAIGISRSAYYRKKRGVSEYTRQEIEDTIHFLELDSPIPIFFASKVS